jgi:hypothetical protein
MGNSDVDPNVVVVTVQEAKATPAPGTVFHNGRVRGVVVAGRSSRNKALALLDCSFANCEKKHERESSDWHQCHRCLSHAGAGRLADAKTAGRSGTSARPEAVLSGREANLVEMSQLAERIATYRRERNDRASFDCYAFADYRGDKGDSGGGVVLAVALGAGPISIVQGVSSRKALSSAFMRLLGAATNANLRVLFGQDHQYGIPIAFAKELGLPTEDWREAMTGLFATGPFSTWAKDADAGGFAAEVNRWLVARGASPYFWSATKRTRYGIQGQSSRSPEHATLRRMTEAQIGFPFCRIGDPGSVGGQSIVGIPRLLHLLEASEREGIVVEVWPFDGLHLTGSKAHVAIEPYPTLVRERGIVQSDENDAVASTAWAQKLDREGALHEALDLRGLGSVEQARVRFEGWIAGIRVDQHLA